jgi:hypothetical protein
VAHDFAAENAKIGSTLKIKLPEGYSVTGQPHRDTIAPAAPILTIEEITRRSIEMWCETKILQMLGDGEFSGPAPKLTMRRRLGRFINDWKSRLSFARRALKGEDLTSSDW